MNTRIQVEHPVTESITNSDLVEMQIKFALGIDLALTEQKKINRTGHAIECRLYAEDPSKNFLPSPGKISKLRFPNVSLVNIRLDIGVDEGDEISFYYDPMIAKIISKGSNRDESINNMIKYLKEFEIEGINTNKSFLISVLQNKTFEEANFNTKFIENNLASFIKKKEDILPIKKQDVAKSKQEYSDEDVKAFEKIIAKTPKNKNGQGYTEKDLKAFDNIFFFKR